jgi:hypothetical protein
MFLLQLTLNVEQEIRLVAGEGFLRLLTGNPR